MNRDVSPLPPPILRRQPVGAGQPTLQARESVACMGCPALADWVKGWVAFAEWLCVLHQVGGTWCEGDVGRAATTGGTLLSDSVEDSSTIFGTVRVSCSIVTGW